MVANLPTSKPKARKITADDLNAIAKLCAKRITETGACLMLGIKPEQWMLWKTRSKRSGRFDKEVTRIRESKLEACIDAIDEAGDSATVTVNGKEYEKRGDWRAKAWIAEQVLAPERFGQRHESTTNQTVNIIGDAAVNKVLAMFKQQRQAKLIDVTTPAQLTEPKTD